MDDERPATKPIGIFMSLEKILEKVDKIDEDLNGRLRKLEVQLAALWVTHGIIIAVVISYASTQITGGTK